MTLKDRALKTLWKKEKMLVTSIFSFPTMFSTLSYTSSIIRVTLKLSVVTVLLNMKVLEKRTAEIQSAPGGFEPRGKDPWLLWQGRPIP